MGDAKYDILVYPNPVEYGSTIGLRVISPNDNNASVKIFDTNGIQLFSEVYKAFQGINEFNIISNGLPTGMYYIIVNIEDERKVAKILVK